MTPKTVEIYGLVDPASGKVRYIGKAVCAEKRLQSHIKDSRRRRTPVACWIRSLCERGLAPGVKVLLTVPSAEWPSHERAVIAHARSRGLPLLNVADGGDEPHCPTEVRALNGRNNAAKRAANPQARKIWHLNLMMGNAIKDGFLSNAKREQVRQAARSAPHLFGRLVNIPDREEYPDGSPVHQPGRSVARRAT